MKYCFALTLLICVLSEATISRITTSKNLDNIKHDKPRELGMMGPSDAEKAEREARKDKNILELKMMIAESKKDNEIRGINAKLEELEQNAAEIQDTMYAKVGELMNLVSRIRAQRIAGARVQVIGIKN